MAQLVGTNCIHCCKRIGSELGAEFCSACHHPRHLSCGQPTIHQPEKCVKCGGPPFDAAEEAARQAAERAAAPRPLNFVEAARDAGEFVRMLKFLGLAAVFLALAVALVVSPDMRSGPNRVTANDLLYSVVLGAGAIAFGGVGVWVYRNDRKKAAARQR